ncbi:MAG: NAD(P)/FAD-dependent oxidoreductase [Anaerolineae bacterium]|nr:FAD-dependent oxidoreductase [Anaerolineales bacterium]MCQ3977038.1 FAD-dependent oxidoreductase [Anaerolineae bacterium]
MPTVMREIVIIGAGMAGLAAAQRLHQAGLPALALEARQRVGGRVWTDRSRGIVEFGAEFIHGKKAVTWDLIRQAGLTATLWPPEALADSATAYRFACQGRLLPSSSDVPARTENLYELVEHYEGPEQSAAELMISLAPADDLAAQFALRRLANVEAADVTRLSAQALGLDRRKDTAGWGDDFHVNDGYDSLATFLAQGLEVRLNTAITQIDWNETGAMLHLANGQTIQARRVIVTVPLGVLQAGTLRFCPALPPEKEQAISALAMGSVTKLALWFEQAFWPPFAFLHSDGIVPAWWPVYSEQGAVLMGYTGGPAALKLAALGNEAAIEQGLAEVTALFGSAARETFVKGQLVDWSSDPWARGGYTYTPVGAGNARAELATPVANTLFFAGEATCTNGHPATVHGAIESGWRAVDEILTLAQPNTQV